MLASANQMAQLATDRERNVDNIIDEAEKAVFAMSERRIHHDIQPIRSVLSDYYDHVDEMARRPEEIYGVPTGLDRPG